MATPAPLTQLQTPITQEQILAIAYGIYQSVGFPVASFQDGGTEQTRLLAFTAALEDVSANFIPILANAGFLDFATGAALKLLVQELYNIAFNVAMPVIGNIVLTAAATVQAQTIGAGKLTAVFGASGNRYFNQSLVSIPSGPGSVTALFVAENPGKANNADPANAPALSLSTPIPGVTLSNPASTYTDVKHVGSGTGTLALGGSPVVPHQLIIEITSTGASGVATWSWSLDGAPFVSAGAVSTLTNIGGTGINVTLVNGGSGTSFVDNDTYTFQTPGSWITQQGSDEEASSPAGVNALAIRARNRWSSLSPIAVNQFYQLLVTSTPTVGSQVVQVIVLPDPNINDKLNIVVAGPAGPLPGGTIATIQSYVSPRIQGGVFPLVSSPSPLAIVYAGTVYTTASQRAAVQTALVTALSDFTAGAGINGTIRIAALIDQVMNAGAVDFTGATINGNGSNLTMGSPTSFVLASIPPTINFNYVTLPG